MDSPVRLGVTPVTTTPAEFYCQRFWGFTCPHWICGLCGLSHCPAVPPSLSALKCGNAWSTSQHLTHPVHQPPPCRVFFPSQLPLSTPPTRLDEWFLFNSLVVGLPSTLIFWKFWLFLFSNWLLSFFSLSEDAKHIYLYLHLGWRYEALESKLNEHSILASIRISALKSDCLLL